MDGDGDVTHHRVTHVTSRLVFRLASQTSHTMETPSQPLDKSEASKRPKFYKETTGSYWGDIKEAVKVRVSVGCLRYRTNPTSFKKENLVV